MSTTPAQIEASLRLGIAAEGDDDNPLAPIVNTITEEQISWISSWLAGDGFELKPTARERPAAGDTPTNQNPHRIELEISSGALGILRGDIAFNGVCDAPEGAPCRMWCDNPECQEDEASDEHGDHTLVDQGECGLISGLNADPSYIPEAYDGPKVPLRPGFIELSADIDGVSWRYSDAITDITESEKA